jgi:hypothetical protein
MGNLSYVHLRQGNYPEVLPLAQADLKYSLKQGRLSSVVGLHIILGKAHLALNQNDSVAYHLSQANHYIQYVRQASILADYTNLAQQYYYQNGDIEGGFAALQNQFDALNELVRHRQEQTLNLLQAESELKLANQRLSGLEVQNSQNRKINWLLGGVLVMLSLLVYSYFRRHVVQKRYNQQLAQLNQNLEAEVVNRTREITYQNERIKQIAFQNSHILRAPVARLLGLSNLLTYQLTVDELRLIIDYIKESSQEADKVIYEMNRLLEEAEEASYRQN